MDSELCEFRGALEILRTMLHIAKKILVFLKGQQSNTLLFHIVQRCITFCKDSVL